MLWLILATACSASIALIFRHSEGRQANRYALISANYFVATLVCAGVLLAVGLPGELSVGGVAERVGELDTITSGAFGDEARLSPGGSVAWAVVLGPVGGLLFFVAFVFYQLGVRHHGAGLAGATAKLGILVPMLLALIIWQEMPGPLQWIGVALAVASLLLINLPQFLRRRDKPPLIPGEPGVSAPGVSPTDQTTHRPDHQTPQSPFLPGMTPRARPEQERSRPGEPGVSAPGVTVSGRSSGFKGALLLLFVFGGLAEFSNKVFEQYRAVPDSLTGQVRYLTVFLVGVFTVAFLPSVIATLVRRQPVTRHDLVLGGILGVPNLFSSFCLILALADLPAVVVFPVFGAGTILIISVVERLVWGTRLKPREQLALALTMAAVILIGVGSG